jgi:hypothetical protein
MLVSKKSSQGECGVFNLSWQRIQEIGAVEKPYRAAAKRFCAAPQGFDHLSHRLQSHSCSQFRPNVEFE